MSIPRADSPSLFDSLSCCLAQLGLPRQRKAAPPPPHRTHGAGRLSSHRQCSFGVCFFNGIKRLGESPSHAWRRRFSASHLLRKFGSLPGQRLPRVPGWVTLEASLLFASKGSSSQDVPEPHPLAKGCGRQSCTQTGASAGSP